MDKSATNKPHVNDLADYVGNRNWPLLIDVIQKQFEVAYNHELSHPTLADAARLWNLHFKNDNQQVEVNHKLVDQKLFITIPKNYLFTG